MVDFRKFFIAFAVLALLVAFGPSANAQVNPNPAFICNANAGTPVIVRTEGITELVGDLILNCTGGTPTPAGQKIRAVERDRDPEYKHYQQIAGWRLHRCAIAPR